MNARYWEKCGVARIVRPHKMMSALWKAFWEFLVKITMAYSIWLLIPISSYLPRRNKYLRSYRNLTTIFIAALFITAQLKTT